MFRWFNWADFWPQSRSRNAVAASQPNDQNTQAEITQLLDLVTVNGQPNINVLRSLVNNIAPLSLTVKQMGYDLARQLCEALPSSQQT